MEGACVDDWDQCGGDKWTGTTCCWPGATCVAEGKWFSHCVPDSSAQNPRPTRKDIDAPEPTDDCEDPVAPYEKVSVKN